MPIYYPPLGPGQSYTPQTIWSQLPQIAETIAKAMIYRGERQRDEAVAYQQYVNSLSTSDPVIAAQRAQDSLADPNFKKLVGNKGVEALKTKVSTLPKNAAGQPLWRNLSPEEVAREAVAGVQPKLAEGQVTLQDQQIEAGKNTLFMQDIERIQVPKLLGEKWEYRDPKTGAVRPGTILDLRKNDPNIHMTNTAMKLLNDNVEMWTAAGLPPEQIAEYKKLAAVGSLDQMKLAMEHVRLQIENAKKEAEFLKLQEDKLNAKGLTPDTATGNLVRGYLSDITDLNSKATATTFAFSGTKAKAWFGKKVPEGAIVTDKGKLYDTYVIGGSDLTDLRWGSSNVDDVRRDLYDKIPEDAVVEVITKMIDSTDPTGKRVITSITTESREKLVVRISEMRRTAMEIIPKLTQLAEFAPGAAWDYVRTHPDIIKGVRLVSPDLADAWASGLKQTRPKDKVVDKNPQFTNWLDIVRGQNPQAQDIPLQGQVSEDPDYSADPNE